nr:uncharacterized protein LOC106683688 [Halyomorpha halys]
MDNLTVRFLDNAVRLLKKAKSSEKIDCVINQLRLKSLDASNCAPSEINRSEVCKYCGNAWRDGLFSLYVKCHKNSKITKRVKKIDHISKLSPCRKDFISFYKSQKDNILVRKCMVCKSTTKLSMNKPFNKLKKDNLSMEYVENQNLLSRKRKRKSGKKESFTGLSPAAILQKRLSSSYTKMEEISFEFNDVSEIYEPTDVKNSSVSNVVKNDSLLSSSRKKKRKSGKKQSFAGLSHAAVLQARLSSGSTIIEDTSFKLNNVSQICEPTDVKNLSVPNVVKNDLLSHSAEKKDKTISSGTIPRTVSHSDLNLGIHKSKGKKPKLKNNVLTIKTKKSSKKSFLSELQSLL